MSKNNLSKEDILHLGTLASLKLSDEEVIQYQKQLTETLAYVENLNELDTKEIKATDHTTNVTNVFFEDGTENTRQFTPEEALKNAPQRKGNYFVVPRIME